MPKIGLRYSKYCTVTVAQNADGTETETLGTGKVMGKLVSADVKVDAEAVPHYADDGMDANVAEFTGGSIDLTLSDISDEIEAELLGATVDTTSGELISNSDDSAPYIRLTYIVPKIVDNVKKYCATCLTRVKYSPPGESLATKGKTTSYGDDKLTGAIMRDKDGNWRLRKTFDTLAAAVEWQNGKVNITVTPPSGP